MFLWLAILLYCWLILRKQKYPTLKVQWLDTSKVLKLQFLIKLANPRLHGEPEYVNEETMSSNNNSLLPGKPLSQSTFLLPFQATIFTEALQKVIEEIVFHATRLPAGNSRTWVLLCQHTLETKCTAHSITGAIFPCLGRLALRPSHTHACSAAAGIGRLAPADPDPALAYYRPIWQSPSTYMQRCTQPPFLLAEGESVERILSSKRVSEWDICFEFIYRAPRGGSFQIHHDTICLNSRSPPI